MKPHVVAIIQGRMDSSRLPGKILLDIAGKPMLSRVYNRTARAASVNEILFATTTAASDDSVVEYCRTSGIPCTRGSQYDVLDRYYQTAKQAKADVVVRITADCPVIDPTLIDETVKLVIRHSSFISEPIDFACTRLPPPWHRTYPIGLDVEACWFGVLENAWKQALEPQQREHAMPYFYEGVELTYVNPRLQTGISPRGFKVALLHHTTDFGKYRWTVDTAEDLEFIRQVYARFEGRDDFSWEQVLELVHNEPALMDINAAVPHRTLKDIDKRATSH